EALVIANGLLTGFPVPTACKTSLLFRSPLTGVLGESSVGGKFGARLKRTGFDGLIVKGRCERPSYLFVSEQGVELRDAAHLWGLDTFAAHDKLQAELPKGAQIGLIGPAGEREVLFASMMFEGQFPRAAGRTGIGCVLGRKRLKAIAVHGEIKPQAHDQQALTAYVRELNQSIKQAAAGLSKFGTAGAVARREVSGDLPIKNWALGSWEGAAKISGQVYADEMLFKNAACFACPIACGKQVELKHGKHAGLRANQPEYESTGALGSNLLIDSPEDLTVSNMLCNKLGLDTISAGVLLSFLFECCERGIVKMDDPQLEGVKPQWGDGEATHKLIEMIANRRGIGDLLADGVRIAAKRLGGGSEHFAVHSKGLELPMHDPRATVSSAATYATGNRGGSHNESFAHYLDEGLKIDDMDFPENIEIYTSQNKGRITARMQEFNSVFDALGLCKFLLSGGVRKPQMIKMIELVFGWKYDDRELMQVGDRIYTLKRMYLQRLGISAADDTLAGRVLLDRRGTGNAGDVLPDLELMLGELYAERGWDAQGRVLPEHASQLNLERYLE
ncbi:MAG: aldehyde ferredoxin oxidoreductase family protein, partial [Candidatus Alcyoniella australis]|nr:aldehyde ferredoxin oxidoreductase family protein [Candidatus Alcyoniella australis]